MVPRRPIARDEVAAAGRRVEQALRGLAVPGPDPDFERRLRSRLLAVAAVQVTGPRPPARHVRRPPRWLPRAVAAGAAAVVGVAGLGVATSRALPGQPLYGAKRQIESWQLAVASGPAARGREQLAFACTRLAEVEALSHHHDLTAAAGTSAGGTRADRIAATLRTMDSETRSGTSELVAAARAGDRQAARQLLAFANSQSARLVAVVPQLPAPAATAADTSRSVLRQVAAVAISLPGAASPAPPRATPEAHANTSRSTGSAPPAVEATPSPAGPTTPGAPVSRVPLPSAPPTWPEPTSSAAADPTTEHSAPAPTAIPELLTAHPRRTS